MVEDVFGQPLSGQFAHEAVVSIRSKWMAGAKAVTGDGFSGDDGDRHSHFTKG
jgi:hypothetical protein